MRKYMNIIIVCVVLLNGCATSSKVFFGEPVYAPKTESITEVYDRFFGEPKVVVASDDDKIVEGKKEVIEEDNKRVVIVVAKGTKVSGLKDSVPEAVLMKYVKYVKAENVDQFDSGVKVGAPYVLAGQVIEYTLT